jgi:cupin 2 domain-containing protein
MKDVGNLLQGLPDAAQGEVFEALVRTGDVLVERIVSQGQASPPGVWYEQSRAEWVLLLQGAARLEWENGEQVALQPGDYVLIAAGRRHRVAWTERAGPTVWLALHFLP